MKIALFCGLAMGQTWLAGSFFCRAFKLSLRSSAYPSIGLIVQLALIELAGWWMVAFRQSALLFSLLTVSVLFIFGAGGLVLIFRRRKDPACLFKQLKRYITIEKTLLLALLALLFILLLRFYRSDADDSFYVSNVLLFSVSDTLNPYDSSFGIRSLGTVPMYDFQVWEAFLSVLCRITGIKAAVLCHTALPLILLTLAVSAYSMLGDVMTENHRKSDLFCVLLLIFYLFGGYASYSKGSFLLSRLWQGKAAYLHVCLPVLLALALPEKEENAVSRGALLLAVTLCGIAMNPTSMYVLGFAMVSLQLAVCFTKRSSRPILPGLPSLGAIACVSLMIWLRTHHYSGQIEAASTVPEGFLRSTLSSFMGTGRMLFVLGAAACACFLWLGSYKEKLLLVGMPLVLFILALNPIMAPVIAGNITMTPSFWRLLWLLPADFALALGGVRIREWLTQKRHGKAWYYRGATLLVVICFTILMGLGGNFLFRQGNGFLPVKNPEHISDEILMMGQKMTEDDGHPVVLAEEYSATVLRQEYDEVELIDSRYNYVLDLFEYHGMHEEAQKRLTLLSFINIEQDGIYRPEDIKALIDELHVGWMITRSCPTWKEDLLRSWGYEICSEAGEYTLFRGT